MNPSVSPRGNLLGDTEERTTPYVRPGRSMILFALAISLQTLSSPPPSGVVSCEHDETDISSGNVCFIFEDVMSEHNNIRIEEANLLDTPSSKVAFDANLMLIRGPVWDLEYCPVHPDYIFDPPSTFGFPPAALEAIIENFVGFCDKVGWDSTP
jgi:hypothetical protein